MRTQDRRYRFGGIVVFLSWSNFAAQTRLAPQVFPGKREGFLRAGEDNKEKEQQCHADSDEQEQRLALVTPEFLPAVHRFLLPSRSIESRPESLAPVSF